MLSKSSTLLWFSGPVFSVMSMKRQCYLKNAVQDHCLNHFYPFPALCSLIRPQRGNTTLKMLSKSCTYYLFPALCSLLFLWRGNATLKMLFKRSKLLSFLALHSLSCPWWGNTTLKMLFKITIQITIILFQTRVLWYVREEAALP